MQELSRAEEILAALQGAQPGAETGSAPAPAAHKVLGLVLDESLYGLDIAGVREVARLVPLTFVPGAPPAILGVANLRGQIMPVIELRRLIGGRAPDDRDDPRPRSARIVVVAHGEIVAGFLVDAVTEVHEFHGPLEPAPQLSDHRLPVEGKVSIGDRVLLVLSLSQLMSRLTE